MNTLTNNARNYVVLVVVGVVIVLCGNALADTKKEKFERAARSNGCDLIPYDDFNSSCREHYGKQREWCTGDRERGCGDLNKDVPKDRETAKERRDNAKECLERRQYVRKIYSDARDRLRDESDAEIKPLADEIIRKIEEGRSGHEDVMRDTENRAKKCDDVYNGH
jgi:hypothetical protein